MPNPSSAWSASTASQDLCVRCGLPLDSKYFDEAGFDDTPDVGHAIVLARFNLNPQYCGLLEYFSQFTNRLAVNPRAVETRGLEWMILSNGSPLAPYLPFESILNPWGYVGVPVAVRLEESSTIEFVVRNRDHQLTGAKRITRVGGRIVGRYWYDVAEGDTAGRRR